MSRRVICLAVVVTSMLLLVPISAQAAGKYVIRDKSGAKVGSATMGNHSVGTVWAKSGKVAGRLAFQDEAWFVLKGRTGMTIVGSVGPHSKKQFDTNDSPVGDHWGRAVLVGSVWSLQTKADGVWVKTGRAPGGLRGAAAAAALPLLLW
jgi:hypothetical protein